MKVSVIIPVYNVSLYIRDCLLSVLNQSYKDLEVIIVNDKTDDDSMEIVASLLLEHPVPFPVRLLEHERNRGLSAARNTGIEHSTGEYLFFLDSDDVIAENCIELLVAPLKEAAADMVVGDYVVKNSDAFFPPLRMKDCLLRDRDAIIKSYMKERIYVMAWNKLVRRDFILGNGLFFKEGLIHEDVLWSFQCACLAHTVAIVKKVTYVYQVRPVSIKNNTGFVKDYNACKTVIEGLADFAVKHGLLHNKYVSSYIEAEKIRLLYLCLHAGVDKATYAPMLYEFIRKVPHASWGQFFKWNVFSIKKLIRDAHYFMLDPQAGAEYFWHVPEYWRYRATFFLQLRYYFWFVKVLCCRLFRIERFRHLSF